MTIKPNLIRRKKMGLKTDGFHQSKKSPLNASWDCPEDSSIYFLILTNVYRIFYKVNVYIVFQNLIASKTRYITAESFSFDGDVFDVLINFFNNRF